MHATAQQIEEMAAAQQRHVAEQLFDLTHMWGPDEFADRAAALMERVDAARRNGSWTISIETLDAEVIAHMLDPETVRRKLLERMDRAGVV